MNKPLTLHFTEFELGYAVGLFEGEGSVSRTTTNPKNPWHSAVMTVVMTDLEPLERLRSILGGTISGPFLVKSPPGAGPRKPRWSWRVQSWRDINAIGAVLRPHLSPRRQSQLDAVLSHAPVLPRGVLTCPAQPIPSPAGYERHRNRGEKPCAICQASRNLWVRQWRSQKLGHEIRRYQRRTGMSITANACVGPPAASVAGYLRHRRRGEQACSVCQESQRLYYRAKKAQGSPQDAKS